MQHEQNPATDERQRQGCSHPRELGMMGRLLDDPGIRLVQGGLEVFDHGLLVGRLEVGKALQDVEDKPLDGRDAQSAGDLSGLVAAHAVADQEDVATVAAVLRLGLRQTALANPEGARQLRNEKVILVRRPAPALIGQAEAPDGERGRRGIHRGHCGNGVRLKGGD
jgi:hypothetical protein